MGKGLTDRYLEALVRVNLSDVARETTRAYRTLKAYRMGERRITESAARELVQYLRTRSTEITAAADALEAALKEEGDEETPK